MVKVYPAERATEGELDFYTSEGESWFSLSLLWLGFGFIWWAWSIYPVAWAEKAIEVKQEAGLKHSGRGKETDLAREAVLVNTEISCFRDSQEHDYFLLTQCDFYVLLFIHLRTTNLMTCVMAFSDTNLSWLAVVISVFKSACPV
jgi:hypothetical protein